VSAAVAIAATGLTGCQLLTTAQSPFTPGSLNQGIYGSALEYGKGGYETGTQSHVVRRNFFTFDLADACQATSVTLQLVRGVDDEGPHYTINEVTTAASVVNNPAVSDREPVFEDLGDGQTFGDYDLPDEGGPHDVVSFPLNSAGVAAFNAARGGFFTIGGQGSGVQLDPFSSTFIFRETSKAGQVIVSCVDD
jgi:hypothetical protein